MAAMVLALSAVIATPGLAQSEAVEPPAPMALVRELGPDRTGTEHPAGVAFSAAADALLVVGSAVPTSGGVVDVVAVRPTGRVASARLAVRAPDPLNSVFDAATGRLLMLAAPASDQLVAVPTAPDLTLDTGKLTRRTLRPVGVRKPQGMTIDASTGTWYILDAAGPRLVRFHPGSDGAFTAAGRSSIDLRALGVEDARGVAFDPTRDTLHVYSPAQHTLYEVSQAGVLIARRDLSSLGIVDSGGMVFAPSGDLTDDPVEMSLYLADAGGVAPATEGDAAKSGAAATLAVPAPGRILELSLAAAAAPGPIAYTAGLVRTTDLSQISPVSPDPSGITFLPASNTLLISDGEVEETVSGITHFQGSNLWEMSLDGGVVRTANISKVAPTVAKVTNEPTGVAWNPNNGHYYVTDDDARRVYDINPGLDGQIGTSDDRWTFFSTLGVGDIDPEGIAYDSWRDRLFVADGENREIYEYTTGGTLVGQFDVERYGVSDPESVEFVSASGTLLVLSNPPNRIVVETTTDGALLRTIDVAAATATAPAGLALAPASDGSGAPRYYMVDRAIDNNVNPSIVDGKLFEVSAPPLLPAGYNTPPVVDAGPDLSVTLPADAALHGTLTDDGLPDPPSAVTAAWSVVSGPSFVAFAEPAAADTTARFTLAGTYVLRLTASDGELSASDTVTVTVEGNPTILSTDVRISAGSDDAEERATGGMDLPSTDLDMMLDTGSKTAVTLRAIGLRFNGLDIPQGATIVAAYIQFQVDEANTESTVLTFQAQATDDAPTFAGTNSNIWSRARTAASASWTVSPWPIVGQQGPDQRSPNLIAVVQEVVDRPGWDAGHSMAFIVTGTGQRVAESVEGTATGAPLLHVEWMAPPS